MSKLPKGNRVEKEDKSFLELLVLIAYKYDEISGGRAVELLGKSREEIDELTKARCGDMCSICKGSCRANYKD